MAFFDSSNYYNFFSMIKLIVDINSFVFNFYNMKVGNTKKMLELIFIVTKYSIK